MKRFLMKPRLRSYLVVAAALLVVLWPLFRNGFYESDDGEWMVIRLSAFYQSLMDGQLPVRFLGRLYNSFGYPVANFLYPGYLYIGSFLRLIGFSFTDSIKVILVTSVVLSAVFLYKMLRLHFGRIAAAFGTSVFVLSPYLSFDLYRRGSVGEVLAFLPATLALYLVEANSPALFPFAIAGLLVSHNSLAILFSMLIIGYLLYRRRFAFIPGYLVGIGMAAFFVFPALLESRYVRFDATVVSEPLKYFASGELGFLLSIPIIVLAVVVTLRYRSIRSMPVRFFLIAFAIAVAYSTPVSYPFWTIRAFSKFFQFPYRFLAVSAVSTAWIAAWIYDREPAVLRRLGGLAILVLMVFSVTGIQSAIVMVEREEGYYTTNEATTTVRDEYMPRWVSEVNRDREFVRFDVHEGNAQVVKRTMNTKTIDVEIDAVSDSLIEVHTVYYPGWGAQIDGIPVPIEYDNVHGFMRVQVPKGQHRLLMEFRETPLRFFFDVVSLVSFLTAIVFGVYQVRRGKRSSSVPIRKSRYAKKIR